jgi:hypothetical protein
MTAEHGPVPSPQDQESVMSTWLDEAETIEARMPDQALIEACAARTSFQLTYSRAKTERYFHDDGISGDNIDDALGSGTAPGEWSNGGALIRWMADDPELTEDRVLRQFFTDALSEAIHEALEWFRIDGKTALNPHDGLVETAIYERCSQFAADLWELRKEAGLAS